jgi:diaminopimelate decarboxylase
VAYQQKVFDRVDVHEAIKTYGSPLYIYDESVLRRRCQELKGMLRYPRFQVVYSAKANTNVELLKIVREEGLCVDAMSPGEMYLEQLAGFPAEHITFIGNNVGPEEFAYAVEKGIYCSVDSLSQLHTLGAVNPGGEVCLRINTGIGAGHHEKVVTGGKKAKFGVAQEDIAEAIAVARQYNMRVTGLNHHIGSLFLEGEAYLQAAAHLLELAKAAPDIELLDFGGGFGIPYQHETESRLDLAALGQAMDRLLERWVEENHKEITVKFEPGRYVAAECGAILGRITSVKNNYQTWFIGCDVGFNTLIRPAMYDSYHEIGIVPSAARAYDEYKEPAYLVGPICESGDIIAKDRPLPVCQVGDGLIIHDAGAYGFVMASQYNSRPLPAEILITSQGEIKVIRPAQKLQDLWPNQP